MGVVILAVVPLDSLDEVATAAPPQIQALEGAVGSEDCLCPGVPPNPATAGTQFTWVATGPGNKDLLKDYVVPEFQGEPGSGGGAGSTAAPTANKYTCKCNYGINTGTPPTDASGSGARRRLLGS